MTNKDNDEMKKAFKIWIPLVIVGTIFLLALFIPILVIKFNAVNNKIKDAFYKPILSHYSDVYEFDGYYEDTPDKTKKYLFNWKNKEIYYSFKYKKSFDVNEWFDFEIINDKEVYISRYRSDSKFIKIPESVKIDGKKYIVTGIKENAFVFRNSTYYLNIFSYNKLNDYRGLLEKEKEICIVGNKNIKFLEDNWINFPRINMFMFPNLKYLGNGDYSISYFNLNNNLETAYMRNFVRSNFDGEMRKDKLYIGDNLKLIEYTKDDLASIKNNYDLYNNGIYSYFGGLNIDISSKNKYYTIENNILYSKDLKKVYAVLPKDGEFNFNNDIEELLPFSFCYNYFRSILNFNGKINKINKYVFSGTYCSINFNEVEILEGELFFNTALTLYVSVAKGLNVSENANNIDANMLCRLGIIN